MKMHTRAAVNKAIMYIVLVVMAFIMLVLFQAIPTIVYSVCIFFPVYLAGCKIYP